MRCVRKPYRSLAVLVSSYKSELASPSPAFHAGLFFVWDVKRC
jgi:hypothetical protein